MLRKNNSNGLLFNDMNEWECSGKKRLIWSLCPFFHYYMDERTSKTGYYASLRR